MKRFIFILFLLLNISAAQASGLDGLLGPMDIQKIGSSARGILQEYLDDLYHRECKGKESRPSCQRVRPFYTSSTLPREKVYQPLPPEIEVKLGFIPPGTRYIRQGYTVYLVRNLNYKIYDHVSVWDE